MADPLRLHTAARFGQINKIKQYLLAGDGIDSVDGVGRTPLAVATLASQIPTGRLLLAKGTLMLLSTGGL